MRVLIDTNVLISAMLCENSSPYKAYCKAVTYPNVGMICDQNLEEIHQVFQRKFPNRKNLLQQFFATAKKALEVIHLDKQRIPDVCLLRDETDNPILQAAIQANADILLTGDKDFLESGITNPKIMSPKQFLDL